MKNLYNRNEFLNLKNSINENEIINDNEMINEGLFSFFSNLFKKAKAYLNKIKGGKEIDVIYQKYIKILDNEFKKKAGVDLALAAEEQLQGLQQNTGNQQQNTGNQQQKTANTGNQQNTGNTDNQKNTDNQQNTGVQKQNNSYAYNYKHKLNEDAQDTAVAAAQNVEEKPVEKEPENQDNKKLTLDALKKKAVLMDQILTTIQNKATTEMNNVLAKLGGAEKNPKLAIIIKNKIDDFKLAFLNAKVKALEEGGDKVLANKVATERNKLAKDLSARWNLDKVEHVELDIDGNKVKVGTPYRYKTEDGTKTIKVIKKSDEPGKVVASYTYGDTKDKEQNFQVENIELGFNPEKEKEYNYFSQKNNKEIKVKVVSDPDKNGLVEVAVGENKFKVDKNALNDIPAQAQKPVQSAPAQEQQNK